MYEGFSDDQVIVAARLGLKTFMMNTPERAMSCRALLMVYERRYKQDHSVNTLETILQVGHELLRTTARDHPDRAEVCHQQANRLNELYVLASDEKAFADVISLHREALSLRPFGHKNRADSCVALASALSTRFERTGDDALLTEAVALAKEAKLLSSTSHDVSQFLANLYLARALRLQSELRGDPEMLQDALNLAQNAVQLCKEGSSNEAAINKELADCLRATYRGRSDIKSLNKIVVQDRKAVGLHPSGHLYRSEACANIASSLATLFEATKEVDIGNECLRYCEEAAKTAKRLMRWLPLLVQCRVLLLSGTSLFHLKKGLSCLDQALREDTGNLNAFLNDITVIFGRISQISLPEDFREDVITLCKKATVRLPLLSGFAMDRHTRVRALQACSGLGAELLGCAIQSDSVALGMEFLDRTQCMVWTQATFLRDALKRNIRGRSPRPAKDDSESDSDISEDDNPLEELAGLLRALSVESARNTETTPFFQGKTIRDQRHEWAERCLELIGEIQGTPGMDRFMLGNTYEELVQAASSHLVIVLVSTQGGSFAIVLAPNKPAHALPLDLDIAHLVEMTQEIRNDWNRGEQQSASSGREIVAYVPPDLGEDVLSRLWLQVAKPVIDYLGLQPATGRLRPRLHWCATGRFAALPMHAAGIFEGPEKASCADYFVSSYIPSISSLLQAQRALIPISKSDIRLLLVAEEGGGDTGLKPLHQVVNEVETVYKVTKKHPSIQVLAKLTPAPSIQDVEISLQSANFVHLACHGVQDFQDALNSGFCLHDGRLTISTLMDSSPDEAFFAFLSACETAKGDRAQPDQAMHLAAAMLFAGFRSVVGTMWTMDDSDGPDVASLLYGHLLSQGAVNADDVAYALDAAVAELRNRSVTPERWATFIHIGA